MTKVFMYVLGASPCPDCVRCSVPFEVDGKTIFFGPCHKALRKKLSKCYLKEQDSIRVHKEVVYVVGVNGSNRRNIRKIVWAGQIKRIMTFETAYKDLKSHKYQKMRNAKKSPIHLEPKYENGRFIGYKHISCLHSKGDKWVSDVTSRKTGKYWKLADDQIRLTEQADRYKAFNRDCCFECTNIFFAKREGIPCEGPILTVLRKTQPGAKNVGNYKIFGERKDGSADGLRNKWLLLSGQLAERLIKLIEKRSEYITGKKKHRVVKFKAESKCRNC